jgi:hypothetical protein
MWRDGTEFRVKEPKEFVESAVRGCPSVVGLAA